MDSRDKNSRNQGPDRRRPGHSRREREILNFEALEERTLLNATAGDTPVWHATNLNVSDVRNGPLANAGQDLINVYQAFQAASGDGSKVAAKYPGIRFQGNFVGVDVQGYGNFTTFLSTLKSAGMQVTAADSNRQIAEGWLPINAMVNVAQATQTVGLNPVYTPSVNYKGVANNEAATTIKADTAVSQFGVNGAGVNIGVLSDSVSQLNNGTGLAQSVASGDLPSGVKVLQDGPTDGTDEGRAMLENIYDIAPGANLAFATAYGSGGELDFANNIRALASQANSKIIVDDVGYLTEPMFQDGIVGKVVFNDSVISDSSRIILGVSGTYTLVVQGNDDSTGTSRYA
ncbi:S8/S53 family peptidase, partial [Singulisphaera rosea]